MSIKIETVYDENLASYKGVITDYDKGWKYFVTGRASVYLESLIATNDGVYVVGSEQVSTNGGSCNAFVLKIDKDSGKLVWSRSVKGPGHAHFKSLLYFKVDTIHTVGYAYTQNGYAVIVAGWSHNGDLTTLNVVGMEDENKEFEVVKDPVVYHLVTDEKV